MGALPDGDPPKKPAETPAEIRDLVRAARGAQSIAVEIDALPDSGQLERQDLAQDISLKKMYAIALLAGLGLQLAIADGLFFIYAWKGVHWKMSASVIDVWLGATLVEVVGIVLVVTRYLFPRRSVR